MSGSVVSGRGDLDLIAFGNKYIYVNYLTILKQTIIYKL
jgi:hypothetical protein